MSTISDSGPIEHVQDFTKRTPHIIGRSEEVERLERYLHTGDERQVVYYWARGGLGKTRLLEELQGLIAAENAARGGGYYTTGIIDLYHTDTHSTSDVERIIVERLDPKNRYFSAYREARQRYALLRERGTDPLTLERYRKELAQLFTDGYRNMSVDARKIVLCFDTIELLQYESSIVEEKAGLDTSDTRLKPWLLDKLSKLPKALIVLAGRPQLPPPGEEERDPQARLLEDMKDAFGGDLVTVELRPFTSKETQAFITTLTTEARKASEELPEKELEKPLIPTEYLPVIHRLTGGRPIFLHLVFDLIWNLSLAPQEVLDLFDEYQTLIDAPEDDPQLEDARKAMETRILSAIFNETGPLGEYLKRIALLPKGVDVSILEASLGLPQDEAQVLLKNLEPLSFVKHFKELPGSARIHPKRTFLHDEFYRLLTSRIIHDRRIAERQVAAAVIRSFYDPQIAELRQHMQEAAAEERIALRERLQKLQVERLYYLLISDVRRGYEAYKSLSDYANRHRWVGFGMRLLDEFLRFYNTPERRILFEKAGISHEQVIRESAELWCERFSWWKQRNRGIAFAEAIMTAPEDFYLDPQKHVATWGNIHALWGLARGVLYDYEPAVVKRLREVLDTLPPLVESNIAELLARARLTNAIGFQLRRGGRIDTCVHWYGASKAAYTKLGPEHDQEGFTSLLNNLAFAYAKQGRMTLARAIAHDALRINEQMDNRYTMGLTLSTLSSIALMRGSYTKAREYGEESLGIFEELEDVHGTLLASLAIAKAQRRWAKHEMEKGRAKKQPEVEHRLSAAETILEKAVDLAQTVGMESHLVELHAEYGRLHRDLGRLHVQQEGIEAALPIFHNGARHLRRALESEQLGQATRADFLEDLGEIQFLSGDVEGARSCIEEAMSFIPVAYRIDAETSEGEPTEHEYYAALAKLEMLRGQIAFGERNDPEEGLQHYLQANIYFTRFSPVATERDRLVEYVYQRLRRLSVEQQRELLSDINQWLKERDLEEEARGFLDTLHALLGI